MFTIWSVLGAIKRSSPHGWHNLGPAVKKFGNMSNVFVYGTLKKGQPNHHYMIDGTKGRGQYCGSGITAEKYPLVVAGMYNIPFLLQKPGSGHPVSGEIYNVDSQLLQFLDEFEGCPEVYQRKQVKIRMLEWEASDKVLGVQPDADGMLLCFVYCTNTYDSKWLDLPYCSNYDAFGKFGHPIYVPRSNR